MRHQSEVFFGMSRWLRGSSRERCGSLKPGGHLNIFEHPYGSQGSL